MKKLFTKISLMAVALLFMGVSSAFADATVYYSINYEEDGAVADWVSGNTDRYVVSISGDASNHYLSVGAVGTGNNGTTITCNATSGKVAADADFFELCG